MVGFCIGLVAASLDIASDWSNDVKFGICQRGFWIPRHMYRLHTSAPAPFNNKKIQPPSPNYLQPPSPNSVFMCCRDSPTISECTQWTTWGQFFSSSKGGIECARLFLFLSTPRDALQVTKLLLLRCVCRLHGVFSRLPRARVCSHCSRQRYCGSQSHPRRLWHSQLLERKDTAHQSSSLHALLFIYRIFVLFFAFAERGPGAVHGLGTAARQRGAVCARVVLHCKPLFATVLQVCGWKPAAALLICLFVLHLFCCFRGYYYYY